MFHCQEASRLSEELHEDWCEEVVEDGLGLCDSVERTGSWDFDKRKVEIDAADGGSLSRQNDLEFEEDLSTMAPPFWAEGVGMGRW